MSTTRLKLYNDALTICGERILASLTENREPRRLLDHVWDNDGVKACLEQGQWRFAIRTTMRDYDPSITPEFGYQYAFQKPDDWVSTVGVCSDGFFRSPLNAYEDEEEFWYADLQTIYVRYVSNDSNYGGDLSKWTVAFADFAAAHFASKIIFKLTSDEKKRNSVIQWEERQLKRAKNHNAMGGPTQFPPAGSWSQSRSRRSSRERGNRGSLIG